MRFLRRLLTGLVAVIALLVIIGMVLPREVAVTRSIVIDAPAEAIFPHINDLEAGEAWSPWLGRDPEAVLTYGEIAEGEGATMTWSSEHPQVGSGSSEIIEVLENEFIAVALDFGDMGSADATWYLNETDGGATEVTWGFATDMGAGPAGRWMGLMMDRWVGADYQLGLENLKALVEEGGT